MSLIASDSWYIGAYAEARNKLQLSKLELLSLPVSLSFTAKTGHQLVFIQGVQHQPLLCPVIPTPTGSGASDETSREDWIGISVD